jgi:hypothetical protein
MEELEGISRLKWNSEHFLVYQMVMLQRSREVKTSSAIGQRLTTRMDSWEAGQYTVLVQDTERTALAQLTWVQDVETQYQQAKKFTWLVLQGKLRTAVQWVTE